MWVSGEPELYEEIYEVTGFYGRIYAVGERNQGAWIKGEVLSGDPNGCLLFEEEYPSIRRAKAEVELQVKHRYRTIGRFFSAKHEIERL